MLCLVSLEPVEHLIVSSGLRILDGWILVLADDGESWDYY
jgi:hypothetical protein